MIDANDSSTWTDAEHPFTAEKVREAFKSPYSRESAHNGKRFEILGLSDRRKFDMDETGPYFRIRLEDGTELDADPIEIYEGVGTVGGEPW